MQRQHRLKTTVVFLATMVAGSIPLMIFNWITIGYPLGFRATGNLSVGSGIIEHISNRPLVFYHLFLKSSPDVFLSLIITIPLFVLFLAHLRLKRRSFALFFSLLAIFAFVISLYYLYSHISSSAPINQIFHSNSLFVVSPLLILALIRYRSHDENKKIIWLRNWIWVVIIGYTILFAFVSPLVTSWGIHWGNRILLLIYPLLALLCAKNIENWYRISDRKLNWQTIICVILLLTNLGIQYYSIYILNRKKVFSHRLNQEAQAYHGDVVITNVDWVPQALFSIFFSKMFFVVPTLEQYSQLTEKLSSKEYKEFLFITHAKKETWDLADKGIVDNRLNCFGLYFFMIDLPYNTE